MTITIVDEELLRRYDTTGPRYTSYPTALQFDPNVTSEDYERWVEDSNQDLIPSPLSLYFHIPFCDSICYYCGCSKVVTRDRQQAERYLEYLKREIALQGKHFARDRLVTQMHWGGGTPTFLDDEQILDILTTARRNFRFADNEIGEFNIEVDPRTVDAERIARLGEMGFNRISFGVQDFDPAVQQAVHRVHDKELIQRNIDAARGHGFRSINIDLMYGLPLQTPESYDRTLDDVIDVAPDRIAIYNYAHMPELFKPQRRINVVELPRPDAKLEILKRTIERLQAVGYVHIGMDHFAKPDDDLVRAQREGSLHRNFQGYSTQAESDIIAMGVTAISSIGNNFSQNEKTIETYEKHIDAGELPIARGLELEPDDILRRQIIDSIMCQFELDIRSLEVIWDFDFYEYFQSSLPALLRMVDDGLLTLSPGRIRVTPEGRLLARNICMLFDRYLNNGGDGKVRYSRTI